MTRAIELLSNMLTSRSVRLRECAFKSKEAILALRAAKVIVSSGQVETVFCPECSSIHDVEVLGRHTGWMCEQAGWTVATPEDISAIEVKADRLCELLADAMDVERSWSKPRGKPIIWSIGRFDYQGLTAGTYFMADASDLENFSIARSLLAQEPRTDGMALLTADRSDLSQLRLPYAGRIVPMQECVEITDSGKLEIDREWLARRVLPEELLRRKGPGRPNSAQKLAEELIPTLDRNGELRPLSQGKRHEALLAEAKRKYGEKTTLSKEPCNIAWAKYVSEDNQS
ncbi:MAG: hypothetical protein AAF732_12150 [Pseudomonadota bacterium]